MGLKYSFSGSPPHTREKVMSAGATVKIIQDHPRIRGKKIASPPTQLFKPGSPPHTREKAGHNALGTDQLGITPAYAGKSFGIRFSRIRKRDHPRIRGKKRQPLSIDKNCFRDHPRIRGKKQRHNEQIFNDSGSPPHTREKVKLLELTDGRSRITPAYAGKSFSFSLLACATWDHPRIRGKKSEEGKELLRLKGSPPHTREKGECGTKIKTKKRITPAYAGKRLKNPYNINLDFQIDPEVYSLHL